MYNRIIYILSSIVDEVNIQTEWVTIVGSKCQFLSRTIVRLKSKEEG